MLKKILAWVVTLALVISICPTFTFATGTVGTEILRYQSMEGLPDEEKFTNGTWVNSLTSGSYAEGNPPGADWSVPNEADRTNVRKVVLSNNGNSATWTIDFTGKSVGWYKVSVYLSTKSGYNIGMNVGAEITHAENVEQTQGQITKTDGTQGWIDLGDYNFNGLGNEKIKIYNPDGNRIDLVAIKLTGVAAPTPAAKEFHGYSPNIGGVADTKTDGVWLNYNTDSNNYVDQPNTNWSFPYEYGQYDLNRVNMYNTTVNSVWTPDLTQSDAAWYKLWLYFSVTNNYSEGRNALVSITSNDTTVNSDATVTATGISDNDWIEVGEFYFNGSGTENIKVSNKDGSGRLSLMGMRLIEIPGKPAPVVPVTPPDVSDLPDVNASQTVTDAYAYLADDNSIAMGGISPFGSDTTVTARVTKDGSLKYMDVLQTKSDGSFDLNFPLDPMTDSSGNYIVSFGGGFILKKDMPAVVFANKTDSDRILGSVASSTTANIVTTIQNEPLTALNTTGAYLGLTNQSAPYNALAGKSFASVQELRHAFDTAVAIQTLNESSASSGAALLNQFKDDLGINLSPGSPYAKIKTSDLLNTVYSKVCASNIGLTKAEFTAVYENAVYTAIINGIDTSDRDTLMDYIMAGVQKGYITGLSLTDYNGLTPTEQSAVVDKIIAAKNTAAFASLEGAKGAFNTAVTQVLSERGGTVIVNPPGGSISIGSSGGGTSAIPQPGVGAGSLFNDISSVPWAHNAILYLSGNGVISGVGEGRFEPDRAVTREEFIKMLMMALVMPHAATSNKFNDVNPGDWFYDTVMQAYALGIINGIDFDIFGVGQPITREQLCTIVYRAMMLLDVEIRVDDINVNITDHGAISDYAIDAVEAMYRAEIVNGMGDGSFAPGFTATRAQAAKIIYQLLERMQLL